MHSSIWRRLAPAVSLFSAVAGAAGAAEQTASYPTRPVRFIIAQTTGTSVDTLSRILATKMGELMGQQFVADNRSGAGGTIGAEIASQAAPDGYTLLVSSTGMQVISPQIYRKLNYDPINAFEAIGMFAVTQNIVVVNPAFPVKTLKDLIALAKASPGKYNMANAGAGFQSHLAGVLFTHMAGIDVVHVPYKGGASLVAVMGNEAQVTIAPAPALTGHVRSGRLRAIATAGEKRSPLTPDLPTVIESGVPGYVSTGWAGLMAPKRTSKPILDKVHATMAKAIADPQTREFMERAGGEPLSSTPQEMLRVIKEDYARMGQAIKLAKLKVE
ncbi:MAG TPA: tripartite tricarboxylate transporter substrate binding protein [Burkholderiales bacterium]|nr:tripartite tricarboxylate transporter substrate binding protein [Burkholderiales bacterium]